MSRVKRGGEGGLAGGRSAGRGPDLPAEEDDDAEEYEDVQPSLLGTLLDRKFLIAAARRKEESGWAIVSEDSIGWLPLGNPERPLGAGEAFYLFVGRSLLKSFN